MRIRLTAMLLFEPDFILLDEPTNYLDLKTLLILENFLQSFSGGFMVISHDREFLKRTCRETLEIKKGDFHFFPGNIEEYFAFEEEQKIHIERINKGIEAKQKELSSFIERFRAKASKAAQARSREKQLHRLQKIEVEFAQKNVAIHLECAPAQPGISVKLEDLAIGYNGKSIADGISHIFSKGEHTAILGDNGEGKSTLLKTLSGMLEAVQGQIQWGPKQQIAYYAQHVFQSLDEEDCVLDHLKKQARSAPEQKILDMAGSFLFRGDDVYKSISVLSGGERSRLLLAGLLLSDSNVFLLDEPTNHLDFETVEALGTALKNFQGTLFFISHDRTFVNMVADSILEIQNGKILLYRGSYEDYVFSLENRIQEESAIPDSEEPAEIKIKKAYHIRKEIQSDIRKSRSRCENLESSMRIYEEKQKEKLEEISQNYSMEANEELLKINAELETKEKEWVELQEKIEELEKSLEQ